MKPKLLMMGPMMPRVLEVVAPHFDVLKLWEAPDAESFWRAHGASIRAIATASGCSRAVMERMPTLAVVSSFGVGYDAVDAAAARERGIVVCNTPGVLDDEVADLALALMLAAIRRIPQGDRYVRDGRWLEAPMPFTATLRDKTVGLLGMGRIGQAIARRVAAFGIPVVYHARNARPEVSYRHYADLVSMAREVDILVVIVPGGPGTRRIVNRPVLEALGPTGLLVNIARGSVVDELALVEALAHGKLGAAALDVFEDEPKVPAALLAMEQIVLSPHQGSATQHTRNAMAQLVADNLVAWAQGRPLLTPVPETPSAPRAR